MIFDDFQCACGCNEFKDSGDKYTGMSCINCKTVYNKQTRELIFQSSYSKDLIQKQLSKPIVECPYCHSTNTKKISTMSKAGSVALFGVFAMGKVSKQWKCENCKSEF